MEAVPVETGTLTTLPMAPAESFACHKIPLGAGLNYREVGRDSREGGRLVLAIHQVGLALLLSPTLLTQPVVALLVAADLVAPVQDHIPHTPLTPGPTYIIYPHVFTPQYRVVFTYIHVHVHVSMDVYTLYVHVVYVHVDVLWCLEGRQASVHVESMRTPFSNGSVYC